MFQFVTPTELKVFPQYFPIFGSPSTVMCCKGFCTGFINCNKKWSLVSVYNTNWTNVFSSIFESCVASNKSHDFLYVLCMGFEPNTYGLVCNFLSISPTHQTWFLYKMFSFWIHPFRPSVPVYTFYFHLVLPHETKAKVGCRPNGQHQLGVIMYLF